MYSLTYLQLSQMHTQSYTLIGTQSYSHRHSLNSHKQVFHSYTPETASQSQVHIFPVTDALSYIVTDTSVQSETATDTSLSVRHIQSHSRK